MVYGSVFRRFFSRANPERNGSIRDFSQDRICLYGFGLWGMYAVSALSAVAMTPSKALDVAIILVMAVVMTIIEYIAGIIFIRGMHVKLWDYTKEKGNIKVSSAPSFQSYGACLDACIISLSTRMWWAGSTGFRSIWHFPFSSACFSECSPSTSGILSTSPVRCGTSHRKRISWSNTRS